MYILVTDMIVGNTVCCLFTHFLRHCILFPVKVSLPWVTVQR